MFKGTDWFLLAVRQYLSVHPHVRNQLIDEIVSTFDSESWELFRRKYLTAPAEETYTILEGEDINDNASGRGNLQRIYNPDA